MSSARAAVLALVGLLGGCEGCLKRVPAESVEALPYPTCEDGSDSGPGELLHADVLRSSPGTLEQVVEQYEYRRRGCLVVLTVRQEWARGVADVEVVFDAEWRPLRAWKRMTLPGVDDVVDVRRYELRTDPATMTWRGDEGLRHFWFRGGRPVAVVGPGHGMVSAWIKANPELDVGETVRGQVLDFRELVERVDEVALRRDADRAVPGLGTVRVYTISGRESVFTDEDGWVVGDLAGLRPDAILDTEAPAPLPTPEPPDPRGTP
jgi:hypothetical protein